MGIVLQTEAPPLRREADGGLRVGQSRVLLEIVIRAFQNGETPEEIARAYDTTTLPDIYAVIAYYLRHPEDVDAYLAEREQKAKEVREKIERLQGDQSGLREKLLARQRAKAE